MINVKLNNKKLAVFRKKLLFKPFLMILGGVWGLLPGWQHWTEVAALGGIGTAGRGWAGARFARLGGVGSHNSLI